MPALLTSMVMRASSRRRASRAREIVLAAQIGLERLDLSPGLVGQAVGQHLQAFPVAGDQQEVIPALGETVGVDRADAGGCAGHDGETLIGLGGHCRSPLAARHRLTAFGGRKLPLPAYGANVIVASI